MKMSPFRASVALALVPAVLAQGLRQATGGPAAATPVPWYPEPEPEVSDCTASLITTLCEYKSPGPEFAVASSGKTHCWEYCNEHQPCNFVIFVAGNPYTGTGTCWLYPGENFDESAGKGGCDYLSVFSKPDCGAATPTAGACEATSSPSALASVCGYPAPDDDCFYDCTASSGSTDCLSQCVEADSCSYAVFNPRSGGMSAYSSGTCWMYPSGTYDAKQAKTCSGKPEQFVYENPCPKPAKPSSTGGSSPSATSGSNGGGSSSNDGGSSSNDGGSSSNNGGSSSNGGGSSSSNESSASPSSTGSPGVAEAEGATDGGDTKKDGANGSASTGVSLGGPLAVGLAVLIWQGLQ